MRMARRIVFLIAAAVLLLNLPYLWGLQPYVVLSGSLRPEIPEGSLIYVEIREDPQPEEKLVCIRKPEEGSGENARQVLGVLKFTIPGAGYLMKILDAPVLCVFAAGVCLPVEGAFSLWRKCERREGDSGRKKKYVFRKVLQFWGLLFPEKKL